MRLKHIIQGDTHVTNLRLPSTVPSAAKIQEWAERPCLGLLYVLYVLYIGCLPFY